MGVGPRSTRRKNRRAEANRDALAAFGIDQEEPYAATEGLFLGRGQFARNGLAEKGHENGPLERPLLRFKDRPVDRRLPRPAAIGLPGECRIEDDFLVAPDRGIGLLGHRHGAPREREEERRAIHGSPPSPDESGG